MLPLPNQALKLTRLSARRRGGRASAENAAAHWLCTSSAVQLSASVRRRKRRPLQLNRT